MLKRQINLLIVALVFMVIFGGIVSADMVENIQKEVPASWMEAPKTASETGISEFNQSPIFEERVASGELPEVSQRLPEDPPVLEPLSNIGEYGGTHKLFQDNLDVINYDGLGIVYPKLFRTTPLGRKMVPSLAKGYELNEDATVFTLKLREGLKWSDGESFTTDDFMYWWEAEANNEDLNPISPENWKPVGWEEVEKVDDYTLKIHFTEPNPLFMKNVWNKLGRNGWNHGSPAHFLKQYHPQYTDDKEELQQLVNEEGFDEWYQLYEYIKQDGQSQVEFPMPTMGSYIVTKATETSLLLERNPYYSFVDTEGNQLPYIDNLRIGTVQDWSMYNAKAATGEVTMGVGRVNFQKTPLFKSKEKEENFHINLGQRVHSSQVHFMPNMNHQNDKIRKVMQEVNFRKALSLAINRGELNRTFYFEMGEPSAVTAHPASPYYEESFQRYIEYKPDQARELLDEIGVVDKDGDGYRELPDGSPLNLTVEFFAYRDVVPKILEMVTSQWKEVGLDIGMKSLSANLWNTRTTANKHDITIWAVDPTGSLTFPASPNAATNWAPINVFPYYGAQWMEWSRWNSTDGEKGIEPPQEVKQLIQWYDEAYSTTDEDKRIKLIKNILEVNAEKVWTIGTIGRWKAVRIVNDNLRNVPEHFLMAHSTGSGYTAYYPDTWYFEGGEAAK